MNQKFRAFPKRLEVVAFDCDGVLFDSKEANIAFYTHILETVGLPPVRPDQHEYIHMHPVHESLRFLVPNEVHFQSAWTYCQSIDFRAFNARLHCEPGLLKVLEVAKSSYRTALATNRTVSTRDVLIYHKIDHYFDLVVSASDVPMPKPHPDAMLKIFETFTVSPEEVIYIGDSAVDAAFASACGVYFIAYKNPSLKAHMHISHFDELHPLLLAGRASRVG
ncbi:MAG: HAD family hydrolase [Acidobacteriota bacterium]